MWHQGLAFFLASMIAWPPLASFQGRKPEESRSKRRTRIVFVCEHGAALSVVAAAYFNKIAQEEHLNLHAIARGTTPQKDLAASAREGLNSDGVRFETDRPRRLSRKDVADARRIVSFTHLPARYARLAAAETWKDVPATALNYAIARDAIVNHLRDLIQRLKSEQAP